MERYAKSVLKGWRPTPSEQPITSRSASGCLPASICKTRACGSLLRSLFSPLRRRSLSPETFFISRFPASPHMSLRLYVDKSHDEALTVDQDRAQTGRPWGTAPFYEIAVDVHDSMILINSIIHECPMLLLFF